MIPSSVLVSFCVCLCVPFDISVRVFIYIFVFVSFLRTSGYFFMFMLVCNILPNPFVLSILVPPFSSSVLH